MQEPSDRRVGDEPYDVLVLATGAVPVRPPLPGIDLPGIFALRDLDDVDQIHAWIGRRTANQAVIVGGGYIGLEMAENLSRRGMAVTLLEMTGQVMPPIDPEMVAPVQRGAARGRASICGWATPWPRSSRAPRRDDHRGGAKRRRAVCRPNW